MNKKILEKLGLSESEIQVYKKILKTKESTPADIAKDTGIKRTTCYSIIDGLVQKGLVIENITVRPRTVSVASREEIKSAIDIEKKRFQEKKELLEELATEVEKKTAEELYPVPKIRFVEEGKMVDFLNSRINAWNQSMEEVDNVFWGYQDPSLLDVHETWIKKFWQIAPNYFEVKLLTNDEQSEKRVKGKYERRFTKFWSASVNFLSTTWIIGDYVVILNTKQHPYYCIEIHDKLMAHDQREVFRGLWHMV